MRIALLVSIANSRTTCAPRIRCGAHWFSSDEELIVHKFTATLHLAAALALAGAAGIANAQGLSVYDDVHAPQNSTKLMPNAPLGSEYPTHGNRQAGELDLNPTDPRAQLANGLPNNAEAGGYGAPLAGWRNNVTPPPSGQKME
jgi:hypothetical protein